MNPFDALLTASPDAIAQIIFGVVAGGIVVAALFFASWLRTMLLAVTAVCIIAIVWAHGLPGLMTAGAELLRSRAEVPGHHQGHDPRQDMRRQPVLAPLLAGALVAMFPPRNFISVISAIGAAGRGAVVASVRLFQFPLFVAKPVAATAPLGRRVLAFTPWGYRGMIVISTAAVIAVPGLIAVCAVANPYFKADLRYAHERSSAVEIIDGDGRWIGICRP